MTRPILADAFGHHTWATLRVLDACLELPADQLQTSVPGTFGSVLDTMRHIVGADAGYLFAITGGGRPQIDEDGMDLVALRVEMAANGPLWELVIGGDLDPDLVVVRHRDDGTESHAPLGIRLAQALHHGTDHRSQVCTALTSLGLEPPAIDVWDFADADGRLWDGPTPA